jgi:hypothetical protein
MTECNVENSQALSMANQITSVRIKKESGARIIACPDSNVDKAIISNAKHGFETVAIVGTGTVAETNPKLLSETKSNKSNHVFSFQDKSGVWRSPAGDQFVRFPDGKTLATNYRNYYKKTGQNIRMRDAGFYTMNDGKMYLLDYLGKPTEELNKKLDDLTANPNVQSFSVTGWITKPQKNKIAESGSAQTRAVYVFNEKTTQFQGMMFTPPMKFADIKQYTKKMYGKDSVGLNLDGDFFAGMLDLRGININTIDSKSITQSIGMYYQQSAMCLVVPKNKPQINQLPKELISKAQAKTEERRMDDKLADPWKYFFGIVDKMTGG